MANSRGFTWSPFGSAWADNNAPNAIYLAGPQVTARSCPVVGKKLWWCCGPDRSRNGGEASASVILPKVDGGEVVLHPSGWIDGICMPRGWPLSPDHSVRVVSGQPKTDPHLHAWKKSGGASPCICSLASDWQNDLVDGVRCHQVFKCGPKTERKIEYGMKGSGSI